MPKGGIHEARSTNWKPVSFGLNSASRRSEYRSGGTVAATAVQRIAPCARDGRHRMTAIPNSGTKIMRLSKPMRRPSLGALRRHGPRPVEQHPAQHPEDDEVQVGADRTRLEIPDSSPDALGDVRDAVHGAVDDPVVDRSREAGDPAHDGGGEVHDAVDDVEVEPGDRAAERHAPAHEDEAVELVDPVLVVDGPVRRAAERVAEELG